MDGFIVLAFSGNIPNLAFWRILLHFKEGLRWVLIAFLLLIRLKI